LPVPEDKTAVKSFLQTCQGPAGLDNGGDEVSGGDEKSTNSGINEMLFLL